MSLDKASKQRCFRAAQGCNRKMFICFPVCIAATTRALPQGRAFDEVDELCEISATSVSISFFYFVEEVIAVFGLECFRSPTDEDLRRFVAINTRPGFSGRVGSSNCQHFPWNNCPVV